MSNDGGYRHRPPRPVAEPSAPQPDEPRYIGRSDGGVAADRAWAQERIRNHFAANRMHSDRVSAPVMRATKAGASTSAGAMPAKAPPKTLSGRVPGRDPIPALSTEQTAQQKQQRKDQLKKEQRPADDEQRETPFKPLTDAQFEELEKKVQARTATPAEVKHLDWDRRFNNRRKRGVDRFWAQEKQRIKAGQPPSRNWTPEQKAAILNDEVPKGPDGEPMEGHHMHNALDYPQKAADGKNITPVTKDEHLHKWHGGHFQNDTHGKPNKPDHPDSF